MSHNRDSIDFGTMKISSLFVKLFIPTLLTQIFLAAFNIIDGMIVGKAVGSDALAAVNIASPIYLISSAIGLTFASGVSIVASIHLAKGNNKAADINCTQAIIYPSLLMLLLSLFILLRTDDLCSVFGSSEQLRPLVRAYLKWASPVPFLITLEMVGTFIIRLDGSPKFAMYATVLSTVINMFLDWLFVFPLGWGIKGAAVATTISIVVSVLLVIWFLLKRTSTIHYYPPKFSKTALGLTLRNLGYMAKVGFPSFIGESAITCMIIAGNYMFMERLQEAGVAAYGVCCYLFPLAFMFGNSITQAQMPIISYNIGKGDTGRVSRTIHFSMLSACLSGIVLTLSGVFLALPITSLFLDRGTTAFEIAAHGLPLFSANFILFTLNLVAIGYFQSIENAKASTLFMLLRGIIFVIPSFIILPRLAGNDGLWMAVPVSELLTFIIIVFYYFSQKNDRQTYANN